MDQTLVPPHARVRSRRPSPLALIVAGATAGLAPTLIAPMVILGFGLDPMFTAIAVVCLVLTGLIAAGFRWAPALALLPGLGLPAMLVPSCSPTAARRCS